MIPLFSKGSLIVLQSLSFTKTLYAFDFDGTLAKIVRDPSAARMNETTADLLKKLAELVPVAIISGRSLQDLKSRLSFQPDFLVGNHGLEGNEEIKKSLEDAYKMNQTWLNHLKTINFQPGIEIENKNYSLAIHYRKSRNKANAREQIKAAIQQLSITPNVILGKCVFNLLPRGAPHKGMALLKILKLSKTSHVFYIGDDDTDEDIFSMPYHDGQAMTVRVGKKIRSGARYYIDRQSDINRLLRTLIRYHQPHRVDVEGELR